MNLRVIALAVLVSASGLQAAEHSATELLEKAIFAEQAAGDLAAAVKIYQQILGMHELNSEAAARAQFRLGLAHLKQGDRAAAAKAFQALRSKFPTQKRLIRYAQNLMPPEVDEALGYIRDQYVDVLEADALAEAAIAGALEQLDQHSGFMSAEAMTEFEIGLKGELVGIGIALALEEDQLIVKTPLVGSPAIEAGVRAGDVIISVNGESLASVPVEKKLREAVKRLRGESGSAVTVELQAAGSEPRKLKIVRRPLKLDTLAGDRRAANGQWIFRVPDHEDVGYVRILSFGRDTTEGLRKLLRKFEQDEVRAVVIDLRNTPGGMLQSAVDCSDMFLAEGLIVTVKGRRQNSQVTANPGQLLQDVPVVLLTNRKTASAAEIFAGALRDHDRAVTVGERTFGKGTVQSLIRLKSGSAIRLTTARFYLPEGTSLQRPAVVDDEQEWGVSPTADLAVELTEEQAKAYDEYRSNRDVVGAKPAEEYQDLVLQKALEYLEKDE